MAKPTGMDRLALMLLEDDLKAWLQIKKPKRKVDRAKYFKSKDANKLIHQNK